MKYLRHYLLFIFLFHSYLGACTLCKTQIPSVHTSIELKINDQNHSFEILWDFNKEFSDETLMVYDRDKDKMLNAQELKEVQKNLEEYLVANQFLTYLYFSEDNKSVKMIDFVSKAGVMEFKEGRILYRYKLQAKFDLFPNREYSMEFLDKAMLFNFIMKDFRHNLPMLRTIKAQNAVSFYLDKNSFTPIEKPPQLKSVSIDEEGIEAWLSQKLSDIKKLIQNNLQEIASGESVVAYIWLLFFSFIYGVIHAIGPGHGKSLVASYFLGSGGSTTKALSIAGMIGVVHTFSAFVFSFVLYYLIKGLLSTHFASVEYVVTKVSAVIIIMIALYLLYKKFQKPKIKFTPSLLRGVGFAKAEKKLQNPKMKFTAPTHESSCGCSACNTQSTDIGVVIGAGIIPCPGTVTIFIFTFSLNIYLVGFLSAIFMSLGMSLIIFLMAYLSIKIKKNSGQNERFKVFLEYVSLLFILFLGIILLIL